MRKSTRIVKRVLALFLVVLMSINTMGAIVSDNDGSAFITKAEFDSLKNNFQSQIDQYNTSIDSKIDGAIASYLAGISVAKKTTEQFFDGKGSKILVADMCKFNDLSWGYIGLDASICAINYPGYWPPTVTCTSTALSFPFGRNPASYFEIIRYDDDNKKLVNYANDFNGTFKTTNVVINCASWTVYNSLPTGTLKFRLHGNPYVTKPTKNTEYKTTFEDRYQYFTHLASPGWCYGYGTGFNLGTAWANGEDGSQVAFSSSVSSWSTKTETPIKMIFADDSADQRNKLYTPAGDENSGIDIKCLVADYYSDDTPYAVNYNKTNRTLEFAHPGASTYPVSIGPGKITGLRMTTTNSADVLFGSNETRQMEWTSAGDINGNEATVPNSACPWWEPYFDNDSHYSKEIINNIDDSKINEFSSYGFTGALTEGIPIGLFKEDDECEFELNLPYAMSVGLRTNVFTAGTVVLNTSNDANLEVTIDNVKKTNSNNEVAAGNHKFKIKYVGSGSKPIFIKIGRANADLSTTYRYIVTLPTEYTKTMT